MIVLYEFVFNGPDGSSPQAGLVQGNDGSFYGTTSIGGRGGYGTVFKFTPGGKLTTLATFKGGNGAFPASALIQGSDGNFYGATPAGGATGGGNIFRVTPSGGLAVLANFDIMGTSNPNGVIQGSDGNFYGTTEYGGSSGGGIIFKLTPDGKLTTLANLGYPNGYSTAGLIQGGDGNFYGTTFGSIFKVTPAGVLTTLLDFTETREAGPVSALVQGGDGSLYGTNVQGGSGSGALFRLNPAAAVRAIFSSVATIPIVTDDYAINGSALAVSLGFAPAPGTVLTVVQNTSVVFSDRGGTFTNLPDRGTITATYRGVGYAFSANYEGGSSFSDLTLTLKAAGTVTLGGLAASYSGSPQSATATTNPPGLTVDLTYNGKSTPPTNVGSYAVVGTINDPNYAGSARGTLVIGKAAAAITLGGLSATYTGKAIAATATTNPAGLAVTYTYNGKATAPVNVGSFTVVGTITNADYAGNATGTLTIRLAAPAVYLGAADAQVSYWVNPGGVATTVLFEYSTSPNGPFIQTAPQNLGKGTVPVDVFALLSGLEPGTTYYYRIVTTTGTGSPMDGPLETFTTLGFETTLVAATGTTTVAYESLGNAAIDSADEVAFRATLAGAAADHAGIWANHGSATLDSVAQTGAAAPGAGGAIFASLTDPVYDDNADVAFGGTLKVAAGLVTAANANGVWATDGSLLPNLLAREGSVAPGAGGATFATFTSINMTDLSGAIFAATLTGGTPKVTAANNSGIWEGKESNTLLLMLRMGEAVGAGSGTKTISSFKFPPVETVVDGQTRGFGPHTGHLVTTATFTDKTSGILLAALARTPMAVVETGDVPAGVTSGTVFATFSAPAISDSDGVAFQATVSGGNTTKSNAGGIWLEDLQADTENLVARLGDTAPGTSAAFAAFSDPVVNTGNAVAFEATLNLTKGETGASGIWCNSTGTLALVARQGGQAPGCPVGVTYSAFEELALDDVNGATQQGGVIFMATLSGTGVTAANNTGIFAEDHTGAVQLIVRTGDVLIGKTITALSFLPTESGGNALVAGQTRSFSAATGDLVYNATFSDKSQAIFNVVYPP